MQQPQPQPHPLDIEIGNQDMHDYDVNLERAYYSYAETAENRDDFVLAFGLEETINLDDPEYDIESQQQPITRQSTEETDWTMDDQMPASIPFQSSSRPIAAVYATRLIDVPEDCDYTIAPTYYIIDAETGCMCSDLSNRLVRCIFDEHDPSDYPELYERYRHLVGNQQPDAFYWNGE